MGHGVGEEGRFRKGGNGEYVAQAWPGEVRKVGVRVIMMGGGWRSREGSR